MAGSNKLTKAQIMAALAEKSGLDKKSVNSVLEAISSLIKDQLGAGGPGEITIPNLVRLKATTKPATEERPGINPFTKLPQVIKAKPASRKVRITPVKALKDLVAP